MTGVARKIAIAAQIEEAKASIGEPPVAATSKLQAERLERRRGILATLTFCQEHELAIRAFMASRASGRRYRIVRGQFCWSVNGQDWGPITADLANDILQTLTGGTT